MWVGLTGTALIEAQRARKPPAFTGDAFPLPEGWEASKISLLGVATPGKPVKGGLAAALELLKKKQPALAPPSL